MAKLDMISDEEMYENADMFEMSSRSRTIGVLLTLQHGWRKFTSTEHCIRYAGKVYRYMYISNSQKQIEKGLNWRRSILLMLEHTLKSHTTI